MPKRFHCGRIVETKDVRVKNVRSRDGGGTRVINTLDDQMTFEEIHYQL